MSSALTWADLFSNGSLIDLDVKLWDGLVRLRAKDLGIIETDAIKTAITFGHERLVAKETLQEIRDAAYASRQTVDAHTISFKLVPGSRFLPKAHRTTLEEKLTELKTKFLAAVNKFVNEYNENKRKQYEALRTALMQATGNKKDVVETALARISGEYPTTEELRNRFAVYWKVYSIASTQDGTNAGNEGNTIRQEIEAMIDRLREQLTAKVKSILELAGRGGKITAKTYNSAIALCDKLQTLNIFGDAGLQAAVGSIRQAVNAASGTENAAQVLQDGLGTVEQELTKSREDAIKQAANRLTGAAERRMQG